MKKMMTNMKTLVALLMAGAAVTSCSSDNEMDSPKAPAGKTYTMTVQATKGGDAMTRALADGGNGTLTATWATTENVYVKKGSDWATGSLKPQTAAASTTLKGELSDVTIAADDVLTLQFPKSGDITYAEQKGTLADIAANFDWAIAENVWVVSVDGDGNIDTGENVIEFDHQQAIVRFTLKKSDGTALPSNPTAFTMTDGTSTVELTNIPAETYTTNGAGVLYVAFPASNGDADITLTATVGTDTYTCTASSKTFNIGNFYRVTAKMTKQANGPEAVDLGLPSGTLWANMNVGAARESDFGKYFAWGETTGYDSSDGHSFGWANYSLCNGSQTTMTKYCNKEGYGTVDNKTTLEAADDAATANWGSPWRMPTKAEMQELVDTQNNTTDYTWELTTVDGHKGYRITRKSTGANIFLPASGNYGSSLYDLNYYGYYWSSSLDEESDSNPSNSYYLGTNNTNAGVYYRNNRYLGLSVRPVQGAATPAVPEGAISGKFTINSSGDKVFFSKGNLQYQASTSTWRFAENQYDYVGDGGTNGGNVTGSDNRNISENYTGWIDLFGWGTGDNPTKTSQDDYGSFTDWGTAAASSIGSGWKTLSSTEWEYLFGTNSSNKRTTTSGILYAKATVNGVAGVILLPDNWSSSYYTLNSTNTPTANFDTNIISASDWTSKLESHGCVFLPAAGDRGGIMVISVGSRGYYWSSTANGTSGAYSVYFESGSQYGGVAPASSLYRYLGFSVRLVHDVE